MRVGRTMLASGALTVGAFAALGLGACGGGGGDADVGATLTTVAPADTPAPTTTVQTTLPPSTVPTAPPPAEGELELTDALRAEIIAAYDVAIAAYLTAVYDPVEPDLPDIAATRVPATANALTEWLRDLAERGWSARPSEQDLEERKVLAVELVSPTESRLDVCAVSDAVIFDTRSGNIVNDLVVTTRDSVTMRLGGNEWLLESSETVETFEGIGSCSVFA